MMKVSLSQSIKCEYYKVLTRSLIVVANWATVSAGSIYRIAPESDLRRFEKNMSCSESGGDSVHFRFTRKTAVIF